MTHSGPTRSAYDPRRRILVLAAVCVVAAGGLVVQLLRLQVLDRERYVAWGEDQRLITIPLQGMRGDILDRNGEELAISLSSPMIYADPLLVLDPVAEASALAPVLGRDARELQALLASAGRFVYLERPATDALAEEVAALGLPGVFIGEEPQRFHPAGDRLARGVLGFVGHDSAAWSGLEVQYDAALAGRPGQLVSERGVGGRTIPEGERELRPAVDGADIELTIDRALQFEVERALGEHVRTAGASGGIAIISEPATGHILAMASVASTDDGAVVPTSDNRAVTWTYEPASVMKAVTFAAVLNEGLATPTTRRRVQDRLQLYEETFTDDELYGTKVMTTTDILVRSSNNGTILWADDLGDATLHDYLGRFGFGGGTGLDFPGESPGLLPDIESWSGTSFATIAIGQGIAVTPLQMLAAYNVLANEGMYVSPRLVSRIHGSDGPIAVEAPPARRVIDSDAATAVTGMLSRVVEGGTARAARVPGYAIAAKTGTARKVQESGGYLDTEGRFHHVATVAGYFPAEAPEYSMIVILDEPTSEIYASRVAAPLFGELAGWTLRHYQVSPAADILVQGDGRLPTADEVASGPREGAGG